MQHFFVHVMYIMLRYEEKFWLGKESSKVKENSFNWLWVNLRMTSAFIGRNYSNIFTSLKRILLFYSRIKENDSCNRNCYVFWLRNTKNLYLYHCTRRNPSEFKMAFINSLLLDKESVSILNYAGQIEFNIFVEKYFMQIMEIKNLY